jgi:Holliday junction DNA helicase RuvA
MFLRLISVKGIGPKGALSILASGTTPQIIEAIESENVTLLKKYPGIGPKAAQQIILDLKGKLAKDVEKIARTELIDVEEALFALGYNKQAISRVIKELAGKEGTTDELIRLALQMMLK